MKTVLIVFLSLTVGFGIGAYFMSNKFEKQEAMHKSMTSWKYSLAKDTCGVFTTTDPDLQKERLFLIKHTRKDWSNYSQKVFSDFIEGQTAKCAMDVIGMTK